MLVDLKNSLIIKKQNCITREYYIGGMNVVVILCQMNTHFIHLAYSSYVVVSCYIIGFCHNCRSLHSLTLISAHLQGISLFLVGHGSMFYPLTNQKLQWYHLCVCLHHHTYDLSSHLRLQFSF